MCPKYIFYTSPRKTTVKKEKMTSTLIQLWLKDDPQSLACIRKPNGSLWLSFVELHNRFIIHKQNRSQSLQSRRGVARSILQKDGLFKFCNATTYETKLLKDVDVIGPNGPTAQLVAVDDVPEWLEKCKCEDAGHKLAQAIDVLQKTFVRGESIIKKRGRPIGSCKKRKSNDANLDTSSVVDLVNKRQELEITKEEEEDDDEFELFTLLEKEEKYEYREPIELFSMFKPLPPPPPFQYSESSWCEIPDVQSLESEANIEITNNSDWMSHVWAP